VTIALRTQQVIAHETGVANVADPLGGSYYLEWLTNRLESEALDYIRRIDEMGGMLTAVEAGYPQREIARSAYDLERQINAQERVVVGINRYQRDEPARIPTLKVDESVARAQIEGLRRVRADRSQADVDNALAGIRRVAEMSQNLVPEIILAAKASATLQEICDVLRAVFGEHHDRGEF